MAERKGGRVDPARAIGTADADEVQRPKGRTEGFLEGEEVLEVERRWRSARGCTPAELRLPVFFPLPHWDPARRARGEFYSVRPSDDVPVVETAEWGEEGLSASQAARERETARRLDGLDRALKRAERLARELAGSGHREVPQSPTFFETIQSLRSEVARRRFWVKPVRGFKRQERGTGAMILLHLHGLSHREIADVLNWYGYWTDVAVEAETVKARLHAARANGTLTGNWPP